ncbi:MAG: hypothetical protein MK226_12295 [Saprospiraceae bacterium]|nr:hypothetical protein [Saprospiraceae bacterium]
MRDDNQKELFNLFRDNQHKLDQKPSNQAWRRLESRLDAHQNRTRISFVRHLSMAAAIAALLALIFAISIFLDHGNHHNMAEREQQLNFVLEELDQRDADEGALKVVEFSRQYQDRMRNPIEEGTEKKKIVLSSPKS